MKTLYMVILIILLSSCVEELKKDSFEDYIKWCEQTIETEHIGFRVSAMHDGIYFTNGHIYFSSVSHDIRRCASYPMDVKEMTTSIIRMARDTLYTDINVSCGAWKRNQQRETPTIEGYQKWKNNKK